MGDIIKASAAGFPANNTNEITSVHKLADLLEKKLLKPEFYYNDKYPNIDGYITIVDDRQVPIGKIEVQIKTLPDKAIDDPKFQCPIEFLSYCEKASLPVLLVIVNSTHEKAFWLHVDRKFLEKISTKIKGKTVAIKFSKKNIISRTDAKYVQEWKIIALEHLHRIIYYPLLENKHKELEEKYNYLKVFPKPVHSLLPEEIKKLQLFIDTYNDLINNKFSILKELYYSDFWKIGIGYTSYLTESLSYLLYPIRQGENDLLIREIPKSKEFGRTADAISWHGNNVRNPIEQNAIGYAWEKISNDVIEIVKKPLVKLVTLRLASEFLINLIDNAYSLLNVPIKNKYSLTSILNRLQILYPFWIEEVFDKSLSCEVLFSYAALNQLIEADQERIGLYRAIKRYRSSNVPNCAVKIPHHEAEGEYLDASINYFQSLNIDKIERQYPANDYTRRADGSNFKRSFLTPEQIKTKVDIIYQNMPVLLDEYISVFLSSLKGDVTYFDSFDLTVINVRYTGEQGWDKGPILEVYYLKAETPMSPHIKTYLNGDGSPIVWEGHWHLKEAKLEIDGAFYSLVSSGWTAKHNEFHRTALQEVLHDLTTSRVEKFFKAKLTELSTDNSV